MDTDWTILKYWKLKWEQQCIDCYFLWDGCSCILPMFDTIGRIHPSTFSSLSQQFCCATIYYTSTNNIFLFQLALCTITISRISARTCLTTCFGWECSGLPTTCSTVIASCLGWADFCDTHRGSCSNQHGAILPGISRDRTLPTCRIRTSNVLVSASIVIRLELEKHSNSDLLNWLK